MLAVLTIIGVLGVGLPAALWLIARWRKSVPEKPQVYGEVNKWLVSEYGLGSRDRSLVQEAVLGRYAAVTALDQSPQAHSALRPELLEAARGLATRVVADRFRKLRVGRRIGWVQLATGAFAAVYGVGVLAAGWESNPFFGVYTLLEAGVFVPAGAYTALIIPRRRRRSAQKYLAAAAPEGPGSPLPPADRPANTVEFANRVVARRALAVRLRSQQHCDLRLRRQSHQKSQNGFPVMARAISSLARRPPWASSLNAKCSAAIGSASSRVRGGLLTSSRTSANPTSSSRAPNLSSHDRSTAVRSAVRRLLTAPPPCHTGVKQDEPVSIRAIGSCRARIGSTRRDNVDRRRERAHVTPAPVIVQSVIHVTGPPRLP
jgi:hypothetical protein